MKVFKKITNKVNNSKIIKNPVFLVIGLIAIIIVIALIYFIFLKYSPIMNFKYEGYAVRGKELTENLLSSSEDTEESETSKTANKNLELAKIEEQGTIFKKLNNYFVGNKEKTEINLNYPIYINENSTIYNLSEESMLISKDFEEIASYPNLSISEGKAYDGNKLERADGKEYIFVKTADNIYINLNEIKIKTTVNEYTIPANSILAFTENSIKYYTPNKNILVFNQINDVDTNTNVQIVENNYTYEELLTRLGILVGENNLDSKQEEQSDVIQENTSNEKAPTNQENELKDEQVEETVQGEEKNGYIKPEVTVADFTTEVYTAKSTLTIKDPAGRIIEVPTFEIYKDNKIYLRRTYANSGEIQITGLVAQTEYKVIGKYIYLNENEQKIENTFYEGSFTTKDYSELGTITIAKENGEIYSNKIQLTKVKITSDLKAEVISGISQIEVEVDGIRTILKNNQVNDLLQGKEIIVESLEGLKSNRKINYEIKFYDKNGVELKVENNTGETRTSKEVPTAEVNIKEQDIVSVTLDLKLNDKDNANIENYKYVITKSNGDIEKEERLSKNEKKIVLDDLDQNQYYKIVIYADYDLNNSKGKQESQEIGSLIFATKPISTLGSLEIIVENKELNKTTSTVTYQINEERTDKRLIQILNEVQITIKNGENIVQTDTITGEELAKFKQAEIKEIKYENLRSNRNYKIEITGNVKLGKTSEEIPVTYNYKEFITPKTPTKIEIKNKFVTGNLIEFDVRVEDINNAVLTNKVRMELRDSKNNLINLQEIATNENYIVKTYERLTENETYRISFYADQYNEGSTNATYKANYLIYELKIVTEAGISGSIGLTELTKKGTGKNLIDVTSTVNWRGTFFNTGSQYGGNAYGKEYNAENNELKLTSSGSNGQNYMYDLSRYVGETVTLSTEIKKEGNPTIYIDNDIALGDKDKINITKNVTEEWQEFSYTTVISDSGLLGFELNGSNAFVYLRNIQIELGDKKTNYEEFKYNLTSVIQAEVTDIRNEIEDYYIKEYKNDKLIEERKYTKDIKVLEDFNVDPNSNYKFELVIKVRTREYVLDTQEIYTGNNDEIKGIHSEEEYMSTINPDGKYIMFCDLDFRNTSESTVKFGNINIQFKGSIDFNGHKIIKNTSTVNELFLSIGKEGELKNFVFEMHMDNTIEINGYIGLFRYNYGTVQNFNVILADSTNKPNMNIAILGNENWGKIENFIIEAEKSLYGTSTLTLGVSYNYGVIKNGYTYGENVKIMYTGSGNRNVGVVVINNSGEAQNIFSLINVDTIKQSSGSTNNSGNIITTVGSTGTAKNMYSVGCGENYNLGLGPTIGSVSNQNRISNVYYFTDITFTNTYNRKTTLLSLWDKTFQNQLLNTENVFNIDEFVEQGYYPQLILPKCMPVQKYINLPKVEDKDLPDILYTEVIESTKNTAKVKIHINNPSSETISNIRVKNVNCTIESQEYKDGKSEIIVILDNPTLYVSQYSIISITTKGAYDRDYTREFEDKERLIDIEFYKEINTTDDWKNINKSRTENYILMQDLDFRNNPKDAIITGTYTGKLDGNNHTIRNINTDNDIIINNSNNEIKNLTFENIIITGKTARAIISYANNLENVYATNVKIKVTTATTGAHAGLARSLTGTMKNCGINNVNITNETESTNVVIGGLVGITTGREITNCFATNVNIQTKCSSYTGIGGLVGQAQYISIKNCYTTGSINIDGSIIGGLVGYASNNSSLNNSYSYINMFGDLELAGGIIGNFVAGCNIQNNIAIGNIYTNKLNTTPTSINGSGTLTGTNYVYAYQRINGLTINKTEQNVKMLTAEELLNKETYTNILEYGDAYNYNGQETNILPKLHKINEDGTYSNELLANQTDIFLDTSQELKIESINIEKSAVDQIAGQIIVTNTKELEVTDIEIDGMDIKYVEVITRAGKSYINITATPNKFYDTYKITKIRYMQNGVKREKEAEGKIEVQFYKEIYNFEDWQSIEIGTYQNYRLMNDIDFKGRTNIKTNVTMARLETDGEKHSLKNITLNYSEESKGLINKIQNSIKNIIFENINITNTADNTGVIIYCYGDIDNVEFKELNIKGKNYTGSITRFIGNIGTIQIKEINIIGENYVGGLIAFNNQSNSEVIKLIQGQNIVIEGKDYVGGVIGQGCNHNSNMGEMLVKNVEITGQNYVGGCVGYAGSMIKSEVRNSNISGNSFVGGITGRTTNGYGKLTVIDTTITGTGSSIGGIAGVGRRMDYAEVIRCNVIGTTSLSNSVGGIFGATNYWKSSSLVKDSTISSLGSNVGGIAGYCNEHAYEEAVINTKVEGYSNVGGIVGNLKKGNIYNNYTDAEVIATSHNAGGIIGYLGNTGMTAVSNVSKVYNNYIANGKVKGNSNVGGLFGNIEEDLYMAENYYYSNYVEAYLVSEDNTTVSLGIGGRKEQNKYLKNTYYYKYSNINGENPNINNEPYIPEDVYLVEEDLKKEETYKSKLGWGTNYIYTTLIQGKYPVLKSKNLVDQEGIELPKDSEHIIGEAESLENSENIIDTQSLENQEEPEQAFEYNNKTIQTYSTYSLITAEDGSQVTRNAKLYVKNNNLYAIPAVLSRGQDAGAGAVTSDESVAGVVPVANNLIIDNYNGKEYETVLGSDGKLYDLKEPITYPENFVNSNIESIGNNLNSDSHENLHENSHEIEVVYKNGDKLKFNYQTGEVIDSLETNSSEQLGLFEYIKEKISDIGNSTSDDLFAELTNKYEASKELQAKLEEMSVEEMLSKQNDANDSAGEGIEGATTTENETTNNSLKENKYMSVYDEKIDDYRIYKEEELLDTNKEEVVSENEKIEANNLSEYYASEGKTGNTKMGIVWIVISIIGAGIILIILGGIWGRWLNPGNKKK